MAPDRLKQKSIVIVITRPGGVMDSASDFGSEGCGFKSHPGRYFLPVNVLNFIIIVKFDFMRSSIPQLRLFMFGKITDSG